MIQLGTIITGIWGFDHCSFTKGGDLERKLCFFVWFYSPKNWETFNYIYTDFKT